MAEIQDNENFQMTSQQGQQTAPQLATQATTSQPVRPPTKTVATLNPTTVMKDFLKILMSTMIIMETTVPQATIKQAAEVYARAYALECEREQKLLIRILNAQLAAQTVSYNITRPEAQLIMDQNMRIQEATEQLVQDFQIYSRTVQSLSTEYPIMIDGTRASSSQMFRQSYFDPLGRKMILRSTEAISIDISSIPSVASLFQQLQLKQDNKITDLNVTLTGSVLYTRALLAARIGYQGYFSLEAKSLNSIPTRTMYRVFKCLMGTIAIESNYQLANHRRQRIQTSPVVQNSYSMEPEIRREPIEMFRLEVGLIDLVAWTGFMTDTYYFPGNAAAQIPAFTKEMFMTRYDPRYTIHIDSSRMNRYMLDLIVMTQFIDLASHRYLKRRALSPTGRESVCSSKLFMDDWSEPEPNLAGTKTLLIVDISGAQVTPNWLAQRVDDYKQPLMQDRYLQYFIDDDDISWYDATGLTRQRSIDLYRRFGLLYPTATALALEMMSTTMYGTCYMPLGKNAATAAQTPLAPTTMYRKPPDTGVAPPIQQRCNLKSMFTMQAPLVNTDASQATYAGDLYDEVWSTIYTPAIGLIDGTLLPFSEDQITSGCGGVPMPRDGVYAFLWDIIFPMLSSSAQILIPGLKIPTIEEYISASYGKCFANISIYDYIEANTYFPCLSAVFDRDILGLIGASVAPNSGRVMVESIQKLIPFKPFLHDQISPRSPIANIKEMFTKLKLPDEMKNLVLNAIPLYGLNTSTTFRYASFVAKRRHLVPELYMSIEFPTPQTAFAQIAIQETRPSLEHKIDMRAFWQYQNDPDQGFIQMNDGQGEPRRYISLNTAAIPELHKKLVCMTGDLLFCMAMPNLPGDAPVIVALVFNNTEGSPLDPDFSTAHRSSLTYQDTSFRARIYLPNIRYNRTIRFTEVVWPSAFTFSPGTAIGQLAQDTDQTQEDADMEAKGDALLNLNFRD
jgi:hypothetical protein